MLSSTIVPKINLFVKRKRGIINSGDNVKIPDNVKWILQTLQNSGHEAFVVGGCVRDMILGRKPGDWDITTSAKPAQVKALFRRTIDTGIQHGTVTVMIRNEGYEVTTYRMDGAYEDHRHPKEILFTPDLYEDLKRRDFTINAMAYNPLSGMIDRFDGMGDMERHLIRCVGEPMERFGEDALRMLRGIRFAGQLQFDIEAETLQAIADRAPTLVHVSAERIRTELTKLLVSDGSNRLLLAAETGLSRYFLPELDTMLETPQHNPHHCYDVGHHSLEVVRHVNCFWKKSGLGEKEHVMLVYAALLHDVAKPDCRSTDASGVDHFYAHPEKGAEKARHILRRLKFDNDTVSMVTTLIRYHDRRHENCLIDGTYSQSGKRGMRRLMNQAGAEAMPLLFLLQRADLMAQSDYTREEKLKKLDAAERAYCEIGQAGEAVSIKELAVGGKDLLELGMKPGPALGGILQRMLERVLEDPEMNTRTCLLSLAETWMRDDRKGDLDVRK